LKDKLETTKETLQRCLDNTKALSELFSILDTGKVPDALLQYKDKLNELQDINNKLRIEIGNNVHEVLPKTIEGFDVRIVNEQSIIAHSTQAYKKLKEWLKGNVPREVYGSLNNYKKKFPFLVIAKALAEDIEIYPMPKKYLLKLITSIYNRSLSSRYKEIDLTSYLFCSLLHKYGILSIAEKKFLKIIVSCLIYSDSKRIQMFSRFLNLYGDYTCKDFMSYLLTVRELTSTYSYYSLLESLALKL